jgi:putative nucleotidyltransferase with HDIG domain
MGTPRFARTLTGAALLACLGPVGRVAWGVPIQAPPPPPKATRAVAFEALQAREPDPARIGHALGVEAIMRELARRFPGDPEAWGLAGLLHDIDLAETRTNPSQHGVVGARLILDLGFGAEVAQAVASHDDSAGIPRRSPMDHALYNADRAFWAIRSSGVSLDASARSATADDVRMALEQKGITNRIDEGLLRSCAALGLTLDELLSTSLTAMRKVAP